MMYCIFYCKRCYKTG